MNTFGHRPALIWLSGASHLRRILIFKNNPNVLMHSCQIRHCCWIEDPWFCSLCQWQCDASNLICKADGMKGFFLKSLTIPLQINGGKKPQSLGLSSEKNEGRSRWCVFICGQIRCPFASSCPLLPGLQIQSHISHSFSQCHNFGWKSKKAERGRNPVLVLVSQYSPPKETQHNYYLSQNALSSNFLTLYVSIPKL